MSEEVQSAESGVGSEDWSLLSLQPCDSRLPTSLPVPNAPITVRAGTMDDLPFIDALQKKQSKAVGWMPTKSLEGKIALGQVLIAEEVGSRESGVEREDLSAHSLPTPRSALPTPLGYCIGSDRYFKRDDVGIIYQMNVVPGRQRGLIGATLLKAQFERSAYGCRLYCCWCAQDLAANKFWEAMGFVPLAYRAGSPTRGAKGTPRVHIFWQRRIRAGDTTTPWWFPSQTTGGSIREDRLVLPIPPGVHWSDAKPIVLPGGSAECGVGSTEETVRRLPSPRGSSSLRTPDSVLRTEKKSRIIGGGLRFGAAGSVVTAAAPIKTKAKREPRAKQKNDPKLVAAARELRDRYLEHVNGQSPGAEPIAVTGGKYDVSRTIDATVAIEVTALPAPGGVGGSVGVPLLIAA